MEIRRLEVDFDNNILKINGAKVEKPVIVILPGEVTGFPLRKLFNPHNILDKTRKTDRIEVAYISTNQ